MNSTRLLPQDRPYLEWRAEEAGTSVDELAPYSDALVGELDGMGRNPTSQDSPTRPRSRINYHGLSDTYPLADSRIAFVGAGAGTIMLASYLVQRGALPEHMTIFDPSGDFGGKWQDPDVRVGGFNNPMALGFGADHGLGLIDRAGYHMLAYLRGVADDHLADDCELVTAPVSSLSSQNSENGWLLETPEGDMTEADIVVLASGTPHPNKIDGDRFRSNLDQFPECSPDGSFAVERHQRELTVEELEQSAMGKPIVIIGLGNSMAAMIHQIQQFEDSTGSRLNYTILTDRSVFAVDDPFGNYDGKRSIFRNPERDYLTGYSADIDRDRRSFFRARDEGRILPYVSDIKYSQRSGKLKVKTSDGRKYQCEDPQVFALIGHQPDLRLFRQMGALGLDHSSRDGFTNTRRLIRPADGAVFSRENGGFMSNVFAIGSVAATGSNRHSLVIPGINGQVPSSTLTIGVRSIAEELRTDAFSAALRRNLGHRALKFFPNGETIHEEPELALHFGNKIHYKYYRSGEIHLDNQKG